MIISIIYRMILDYIKDHRSLPPVLFINVDNCGRENKVVFAISNLLNYNSFRCVFSVLIQF